MSAILERERERGREEGRKKGRARKRKEGQEKEGKGSIYPQNDRCINGPLDMNLLKRGRGAHILSNVK